MHGPCTAVKCTGSWGAGIKLNGGFGHVYGDGVRVHREFNAASNGTLSVLASKSRL